SSLYTLLLHCADLSTLSLHDLFRSEIEELRDRRPLERQVGVPPPRPTVLHRRVVVGDVDAPGEADAVIHHQDLAVVPPPDPGGADRKSTRLNSSHVKNSYAVFCMKQ